MALIYRPVQSTMANKNGEKLWYPSLVKMKEVITTHALAEQIAEKSSLTPGDVHSVIRNLMTTMRMHLLNSYTVRLDGLGTFTMVAQAKGQGASSAKEVNPSQITYLRCQFTPEYTQPTKNVRTRALVQGVKFMSINQFRKMLVGVLEETDKNENNKNENNIGNGGHAGDGGHAEGGGNSGDTPYPIV